MIEYSINPKNIIRIELHDSRQEIDFDASMPWIDTSSYPPRVKIITNEEQPYVISFDNLDDANKYYNEINIKCGFVSI